MFSTRQQVALLGSMAINVIACWMLCRLTPVDEPVIVPVEMVVDIPEINITKTGNSGPVCPGAYVGIGVIYNPLLVIDKAPEGLPAYEAGIRVGDKFAHDPAIYDYGKVDVPVRVVVYRNGVRLVFIVFPKEICFDVKQ